LDEWAGVLRTPGFKFVNLQYGDCEAELRDAEKKYGIEILRWKDLNLKDDIDDVFALIQTLDNVISVQVSTLIQAGVLGVPVVGLKDGGWVRLGHTTKHLWLPTHVRSMDPSELFKLSANPSRKDRPIIKPVDRKN
jgi:hypothetical protein